MSSVLTLPTPSLVSPPSQQQKIYVVDFLNLFSDYREIFYKKQNIDFHLLKHKMLEKDTLGFFKMFFTKYIEHVNLSKNSEYIFILKKITNYNKLLYSIVELYKDIKIKFIVIETIFNSNILDKNKDDFLCQYLFCILLKKNKNVVLLTNDKYRDSAKYISLFNEKNATLQNISYNQSESQSQSPSHSVISTLKINEYVISLMNLMNEKKYYKVGIPKNKLQYVIC